MKISEKKRVQQTADLEHLTFESVQSEKNMVGWGEFILKHFLPLAVCRINIFFTI